MAAAATANGKLGRQIISLKGVSADAGIRAESDLKKLADLKPVVTPTGSVTAGNATFLTDGAAALLLMSETKARELGMRPRGEILDYAFTGHDLNEQLLLGPAFGIPQILKKLGIEMGGVGAFELHEAYAAQILAVLKILGGKLPLEKLNLYGGSIAIGNPFAPNCARLVTTVLDRLEDEKAKFGLVSTCAGGALGLTLVVART